jgi:hypothetical protein
MPVPCRADPGRRAGPTGENVTLAKFTPERNEKCMNGFAAGHHDGIALTEAFQPPPDPFNRPLAESDGDPTIERSA